MTTLVVMVQIETWDPRLTPEALTSRERTAAFVLEQRQAIVDQLATKIERVIAVMPVEQAEALMLLHEAFADELGAPDFVRPPASYRPPTGRGKNDG